MISESKKFFYHLREYLYESPSSKMSHYGIMATQLLTTLTTVHHLLKCEIVVYPVNLRHLLHSISLDVCFVSLDRCCYVSFRVNPELFDLQEDQSFYSFLSPLVVMSVGVLGTRHQDKDGD